jgi:hypothetical protein
MTKTLPLPETGDGVEESPQRACGGPYGFSPLVFNVEPAGREFPKHPKRMHQY